MKKLLSIIILAAGMSISLTSCKDFLKTETESLSTPEVVYNSLDMTNDAISGIYALMNNDQSYSQRLAYYYSINTDIEWTGADNGSWNQQNRAPSNYAATTDNSLLLEPWNNLYRMVERANLAIAGIRKSGLYLNGTAVEKARMGNFLGEALALRALAYSDLCKIWGDVPFTTDPAAPDGSNHYNSATDRDVIYEALIGDLKEASELLPWGGSNERINRGFAKGLLARIALYRGGYSIRNKSGFPTERGSDYLTYYKIANEACADIINSGNYSLNPSFRNIWEKMNSLKPELQENLFEVACGMLMSGEAGYSTGVRFRTNDKYGNGNNTNVVSTGPYYYYQFDSLDVRRDATVAYYEYTANAKETFRSNPFEWTFAKWDQRMMTDAFLDANRKVTSGKLFTGINWALMRYADVLLMFAETENELNNGPTQPAIDAFKQVRRRAFNPVDQPIHVDSYVNAHLTKDSFFNMIVDERSFEFGGEGIRKFDLVRWNLLDSKIQEQRDEFKSMLARTGKYANLPTAVYYSYAAANSDQIDRNTINMYSQRNVTSTPTGYTKVDFLSGASEANKADWIRRVDLFSSGLNTGSVKNRHLFPMHNTVVAESAGHLVNGYGF